MNNRKTILSVVVTAVMLAFLSSLSVFTQDLLANDMSGVSRDVINGRYDDDYKESGPIMSGWYFWVTIEDMSGTGLRNCDNGEGYIVLRTYNGAWYSKVPAGIMDSANVKYTFRLGEENNYTQSGYDSSKDFFSPKNNKVMYGSFPYELKLVKTNDPESEDYMVSNNDTWKSRWKITLYCTGDTTKAAKEVCSWVEDTAAGIWGGTWSDKKEIPEKNRSKKSKITNLQGPDEIVRPDLGGKDVNAYYTIDIFDQYGGAWSTYLAGETDIEWTTRSNTIGYYGCSIRTTGGGPINRFYTGQLTITQYQLELAEKSGSIPGDLDTFVKVTGPDGTSLEKTVKLIWPKHKVTFKDGDGKIFDGPNTVNSLSFVVYPTKEPKKSPTMENHYDFVKPNAIFPSWWSNESEDERIRKDSVFYPYFETKEHYYHYDAENRNHKCNGCGYVASLSDKLKGSGTENDPWLIGNIDDWRYLAKYLKLCGNIPEDAYFALTGDINGVDYDSAIGAPSGNIFTGNVDGRGHTVTLKFNSSDDKTFAPFIYIKDTTIKNLKVAGSAKAGACAGIAMTADGTNLIDNCIVSADLTSLKNGCAGFIKNGYKSSTTIKNSIFAGSLNFSNVSSQSAASFWGGSGYNPTPSIINCLDLGNNSYPIGTGSVSSNSVPVTNSYYVHSKNDSGWKNGGKLACDLRSENGIELTLIGDTGIWYGGRIYVADGEIFTFSATKEGKRIDELLFASDDGQMQYISSDDSGVFTLTAKNGVLSDYEPSLSLTGSGTESVPYLIKTTDDWNELSDYVSKGGKTSGLWFRLENDISVTTMVGSRYPFLGSFDGSGHKLTVTYTGAQYVSPFCTVGNDGNETVIRNLYVSGTVNASAKNAAGIIGKACGKIEIVNCVSAVVIISDVNGEGAHGGLIGTCESGSDVVIKGCVFEGKILTTASTTSCAGFIGQSSGDLTISDSIYAPKSLSEGETYVSSDGSSTFFRGDKGLVTDSFYTVVFGKPQGKAKHSINAADSYVSVNVTLPSASAVREYNVSGIKVYPSGIVCGEVYYFGAGDEVNITLAHSDRDDHVFEGYKADNATISGSDPSYTITMPDSDVFVSSEWTKVKTVTDPVIELEGDLFTYCGKAVTPAVLSVKDGETIIPQSEYEIRYSDNVNAGTATVTIVDKNGGYYKVSGEVKFTIKPKLITLTWTNTVFTYDGKVHCPVAAVKGLTGNDKCDVTVEGGSSDVGEHKARAIALSNPNYTLPDNCEVSYTIKEKKTEPDVKLTLDKKNAAIVCGDSIQLKVDLKGSTSKITWKSSNPAIAAVDASGKVTAKKAGSVTITASAAGKSASCVVTVLFKDLTDTTAFWYVPANYLSAAGVVKGYDNQTLFKASNKCTRAQAITFIWRLQGEPAPKAKTCRFKDVNSKDYFYKACIWAYENHIVEGYQDKTFRPQNACERKHIVTFLWRLAGKPAPESGTNRFSDLKKGVYYYKATLWASEKGILSGYSDGTFRPDGKCLRRQTITFIYKYDKLVKGKA